MKKCRYCAEEIQDDAIVCRFCGRDLPASSLPLEAPPWEIEARALAREGKRVHAIQRIRQATKLSLAEADALAGEWQRDDTPATPPPLADTQAAAAEGTAPNTTAVFGLVCPKCESQETYSVDVSGSPATVACPRCSTRFIVRILTIRAKRSKGGTQRSFSVRVQRHDGAEELIEFANTTPEDFELRARDVAAFSYLGGSLRVVQNMTVQRYMRVSNPKCLIASCVFGPESEEVATLRRWRDQKLVPNRVGRGMVHGYYVVAPHLIVTMSRFRGLTTLTRVFLRCVLKVLSR